MKPPIQQDANTGPEPLEQTVAREAHPDACMYRPEPESKEEEGSQELSWRASVII